MQTTALCRDDTLCCIQALGSIFAWSAEPCVKIDLTLFIHRYFLRMTEALVTANATLMTESSPNSNAIITSNSSAITVAMRAGIEGTKSTVASHIREEFSPFQDYKYIETCVNISLVMGGYSIIIFGASGWLMASLLINPNKRVLL